MSERLKYKYTLFCTLGVMDRVFSFMFRCEDNWRLLSFIVECKIE